MGAPLARLIAKGPFALTVHDPFPDALNAFDGVCGLAASSREAARGADILCVCVRDDQQVRDVLFGENGAVSALDKGALVLIHSTISVAALRDIAERLRDAGIATVDAPVSRTRQTTDEPFVFAMLGGDPAEVERARPLVQAFATDTGHMGPLGAGMATKIVNNMVTWVHIVAALQATAMAARGGVELEQLLAVMRSNGNLTPTMGAVIAGKFQAPQDDARAALFASQGGIGEKDLALALETAAALGIDTGMIAAAQRLVRPIMSM